MDSSTQNSPASSQDKKPNFGREVFSGGNEATTSSAQAGQSAAQATDPAAYAKTSPNFMTDPPQETKTQENQGGDPAPQENSDAGNQEDYYYDDPYAYMPLPPQKEQIVYEWKAPSRPFKQHNRQYFTTIGTISLLIILILFFAGQILPIAVVLAAGFLVYVLGSIPPHSVVNQITTYGIRTADHLYYWEEMGRFWFKKKYEDEVLNVEVGRFPDRLTLLIGQGEKDVLRELLSLSLLEEEPLPTYYEKAAAWLQDKIPLDIES